MTDSNPSSPTGRFHDDCPECGEYECVCREDALRCPECGEPLELGHDCLADQNPSKRFAEALEDLRAALVELEAIPDAELDEPTRKLRDNTRAMLDRYDRDAYDELVS